MFSPSQASARICFELSFEPTVLGRTVQQPGEPRTSSQSKTTLSPEASALPGENMAQYALTFTAGGPARIALG